MIKEEIQGSAKNKLPWITLQTPSWKIHQWYTILIKRSFTRFKWESVGLIVCWRMFATDDEACRWIWGKGTIALLVDCRYKLSVTCWPGVSQKTAVSWWTVGRPSVNYRLFVGLSVSFSMKFPEHTEATMSLFSITCFNISMSFNITALVAHFTGISERSSLKDEEKKHSGVYNRETKFFYPHKAPYLY